MTIVPTLLAKGLRLCDDGVPGPGATGTAYTHEKTFVIELTGGNDKIDAFEKLLEPYGIRELVYATQNRLTGIF